MTSINLVEPSSDEWKKWRKDGAEGAKALAGQFKKTGAFTVNDDLYKRHKDDYFALYHGKCVYCEELLGGSSFMRLDHFRPKKTPLDFDGKPIRVGKDQHPGYYWLAYDWQNLVPSCEKCNNSKGALFPMLPGSRHSRTPKGVASESPVLIHPAFDNEKPEAHFEYLRTTGALIPKTDRARGIDRIVDLNRERLREDRIDFFAATIDLVKNYVDCLRDPDNVRAAREAKRLEDIASGVCRFSFVGRHALRLCSDRLKPFLIV